ncbi:MAG: DUF2127 domain-containing protein [Alphaproteobacteria bacterium]|nr:DUF2127 domain-containing protein [Alphaproteobacteria bacterium]
MIGKLRHIFFLVSMVLKGIVALAETLSGLTMFFVSTGALRDMTHFLFRNRLLADPHDFIANAIMNSLQDMDVNAHTFIRIYLLLHGLVKLVIFSALLTEKLWTFPVGLTGLGLFIAYQLNRYSYTHATALLVISVLDMLIMVLVWREWVALRQKAANGGSAQH